MSKSRKGEMTLQQLRSRGRVSLAQHHATTAGHPLRPPHPEGAQHDRTRDYVPEGRRGVVRHPSDSARLKVPPYMAAEASASQQLAHEVSNGLRKFTFAQVRRQQPTQRLQGS